MLTYWDSGSGWAAGCRLAHGATESLLPDGFEHLAPFLDWALESERERTEKKVTATMDETLAFYNAMMPRIDEILDYLEGYFGGDAPAHARRLYLMSLSLVEVATLVELYKRPGAVDACDPLRFVRRD